MFEESHRRERLVVALVALLVTVAATVAGVRAASPPKSGAPHSTWAAPQAPPPTAGRLAFGVSYGDTLLFDNDRNLAQGLDDAVALGVRWIRLDLSWEDIQPDSPSGYQWNRFDRVVNAARARGLNLLPTVAYTPSWARSSSCRAGQSCPPANPETFAGFAAQAVERYSAKGITTWEIWNEPNIKPFWEPKPDAAAYTRLLAVTAKAIRHVNPRAYLLMGGLAAVGTDKSIGYVSQTAFLAAVSALGANKLVDAISYHPYTYPYLPTDDTSFGTAFQRISTYTSDNLVAILEKYGTPHEPVWITETGAPTNGPGAAADGRTIPPNATDVTEAYQARIATASVTAAADNPHVAAMFWFADRDSGTAADRAYRSKFYGLRHNNGTAKPAFAALQLAIADYERTRHG